jgi:hypothetical protein
MSTLNFKCPKIDENGEECGRRFSTEKELETHIKSRHPELTNNVRKEKKLLDNLFSEINSLEKYAETEEENFHKELNLEIPNYEDLINSIEEEEEKEGNDDLNHSQEKINVNNNLEEEENLNYSKEEKKESESPNNSIDNKLNNKEEIRTKDNKIIEITEEMIFENQKTENYDEIKEIDFSRKNIASFMNNRKISFESLEELTKINLSYNWISYSFDLRFFKSLKIIELNDNVINEISFVEFLPNLEYLNVENNQINSITSLNKCTQIKILKISLNKIQYQNSTMKTLQNLNNLIELSINNNPFIEEIFSYRNLFISKYKNIQILDNEKISDKEREEAEKFVFENNPIYKNTINRPLSSRINIKNNHNVLIKNNNYNKEINDIFEEENEKDLYFHTQIGFKKNNGNVENKMPIVFNDKINDLEILKKQNKEFFDIINSQNEEIENLKKIIKTLQNNNENEDEEKKKLKEEIINIKKEYNDLLNKTISSNNSTNKTNNSQNYKNEEEEESEDEIDYDELLRKSYQDFAQINKDLEKLKKESENNNNQILNQPKININNNITKPKIMINQNSNPHIMNINNNAVKIHSEKLNPVITKKEFSNKPIIIKSQKNNPIILNNLNKGNSSKIIINPNKK